MTQIAVLLCMSADTPKDLARRAVASTAAGLATGDSIFLLIDGGEREAAEFLTRDAHPIRLEILSSTKRSGLAAGLNHLVDHVLNNPMFGLLARMDADDESLPGRFHEQRAFLEVHQEVDILGGGCREVNEAGVFLQEKRMPQSHEQILEALPRRNPMNHPTVIIRRRVFEAGVRYRDDVGRIEDYHLWVDAAAMGFRFANLPNSVLNFRRDGSFFHRRGGWDLANAEANVRWRAMLVTKAVTPQNLSWMAAAWILRLLPAPLQSLLYRHLR